MKRFIITIFLFFICFSSIYSQNVFLKIDTFFKPKISFNSTRFNYALGIGTVLYSGGTYFLYNSWYKNNGLGNFHFFDDRGEWLQMDKVGHVYTAFNQSYIMYNSAKWTGLSENKSLIFGVSMGMLLQTTVEVLDGFSNKWGFSWSDMAANTLGASVFYLEQRYWGEQKISFKVSSYRKTYSDLPINSINSLKVTTLENRANYLFGSSFAQRYLKDYNTQTYWMSFNLKSFIRSKNIPSWLSIAFGYSGENMFGGFDNKWKDSWGNKYKLDDSYHRYGQFFISPDIDLSKINTNSHFLTMLLKGFNIFKLPMPTLEINTKGELIFHLIYK